MPMFDYPYQAGDHFVGTKFGVKTIDVSHAIPYHVVWDHINA